MSKIFIKLLVVFMCHYMVISNSTKYRIIGGRLTTISKAKYIVSLRQNGKFFCGGTLVSGRYVVTAAHCVKGLKPSDLQVHGGATYLHQKGVKRYVSKIIIPKVFNLLNVTMDVAVLKLSKPMRGKNISTIALCSHRLNGGDSVNVFGWGLTDENGANPSQQLRSVKVRIISYNKCQTEYRGIAKISRTMMCASIPGKKDACSGDSGGPLVDRGQLCGIVSFGIGCGRQQYPGVYTVVNRVEKFIKAAMKN